MSDLISRRAFAAAALAAGGAHLSAEDKPKKDQPRKPTEAAFERDYAAPEFQPSWKKPQINRLLVQDFVIYAHMDLAMVKKLLEKEPALLHAHMDWGGGDWESALGAGSHMGKRDVVEHLLERGARVDIFCAAMLGQLDVVKALLKLQPKLIDAKGPHGIGLHAHARAGGKQGEATLEYLQSVKKVEFESIPKKDGAKDKDKK